MTSTTRAYTLRLRSNAEQRQMLWQTHLTFNRGVRVFGDWLLTLRGGLPASLADSEELLKISEADCKTQKDLLKSQLIVEVRNENREANAETVESEARRRLEAVTDEAISDAARQRKRSFVRRILAISWLSPESPAACVPKAAVVANADESDRGQRVIDRFKEILNRKGVTDPQSWMNDCETALRAAIRSDALWIDRDQCHREMPDDIRPSPDEAAENLFDLIGSQGDYFQIPELGELAEAKNLSTSCGDWISRNWGEGPKSDASKIAKSLEIIERIDRPTATGLTGQEFLSEIVRKLDITVDQPSFKDVCKAIGWKGSPSATRLRLEKIVESSERVSEEAFDHLHKAIRSDIEKQKKKLGKPLPCWSRPLREHLSNAVEMPFKPKVGRSHHYEFSTMLAAAMRRVSQIHTKAKQAEAERMNFERARQKRDCLSPAVVEWLEAYIAERSVSSGASTGYRLRIRAVEGWSDVVAEWHKRRSVEERIQAVRDLQTEWDKAGDVQLFEALAAEDAKPVWQSATSKPDPSILRDFVAAEVADEKSVRYKVPSYRHPDPFRSPAFVGFGNSQWEISFSAKEEFDRRKKADEKLNKAKTPDQKARQQAILDAEPDLQGVTFKLFSGGELHDVSMRWQSKRLFNELAIGSIQMKAAQSVTRSTRFGRASLPESTAVRVAAIFDATEWNGRLQLSRRQLEDVARLLDRKSLSYDDPSAWPEEVTKKISHLRWLVTHSAHLETAGPWLDYRRAGLPAGYIFNEKKNRLYWDSKVEGKRSGKAQVRLSRLPELRVLSIDLGIRDSAAAVVWQAVSKAAFEKAKAAGVEVVERGVLCSIKGVDQRTTHYRQVGPSNWAKMDRKFLIRLDGEAKPARRAKPDEVELARELGVSVDAGVNEPWSQLPRVDRLQRDAVRVCRFEVRRLGDLARISYGITATEKPVMGGQVLPLDDAGRQAAALDALVAWHRVATAESDSVDSMALLWNELLVVEKNAPALLTKHPRSKKKVLELRESLAATAARVSGDAQVAKEIADEWGRTDEAVRHKIRKLRRWLMPRFRKTVGGGKEHHNRVERARNVGGISIERIAAIEGLLKVLKSYSDRPHPTNLRKGIEAIEAAAAKKIRPEFGRRIREKMEKLRENRVKQLASRIVEAALGLGSEAAQHRPNSRRRAVATPSDPRFAPCHAVVIESLKHYRPDEKRTRRENRSLMRWSSGAIAKYLEESCELHGLYLLEVPPAYTSRQDCLTGAAGMRCNDFHSDVIAYASGNKSISLSSEQKSEAGWLSDQIQGARDAVLKGNATPRQSLILEVAEFVQSGSGSIRKLVRLPVRGGQVFVPAISETPACGGIHADINAAGNIGLVALLDPDWHGTWWRLPCDPKTGQLAAKEVEGSPIMSEGVSILPQKNTDSKAKRIINAWCDVQSEKFTSKSRQWLPYDVYWGAVEEAVCMRLREWNGIS